MDGYDSIPAHGLARVITTGVRVWEAGARNAWSMEAMPWATVGTTPEIRAWELFTMLIGTTSGQEGAMDSSVLRAA